MAHPAPTHIQMLAARWRIFAKALAAAARAVLQPHRGCVVASADEVEVWVFASIVILNRQIAFLSEQTAGDPETDAALNDLKALAVILLRLPMIIACFKARIARAPWHQSETVQNIHASLTQPCLAAARLPTPLSSAPFEYIDSS